MKVILVVAGFIGYLFTGCRESTIQSAKEKSKNHVAVPAMQVDTAIYVIFPYDNSLHWLFKNSTPTTLTSEELIIIERIVTQAVSEYTAEQERYFEQVRKEHPKTDYDRANFTINLKNYKRQYIPIINEKGEKEVWVNCICKRNNANWRKEIILVLDGEIAIFS